MVAISMAIVSMAIVRAKADKALTVGTEVPQRGSGLKPNFLSKNV
jgi:hypothetical protein